MKTLQLWTTDGKPIARQARPICTFRSRCARLLRNVRSDEQDALLVTPGGSVHTLGMRAAIDVVFLSRQMRVVGLAPNIPPWSFRRAPAGTGRVLELAAGRIEAIGLTPGTFVMVESAPEDEGPTVICRGVEVRAPRASCQRLPIQFSLRLPLERRCAPCGGARCQLPKVPTRPP